MTVEELFSTQSTEATLQGGFEFDDLAFWRKFVPVLQQLLQKRFADSPKKQTVIQHSDCLNFACPVCGDSRRNPNKKRGHVYLDGYSFKCYNDHTADQPAFMSLTAFIRRFGLQDRFTDDELYVIEEKFKQGLSKRDYTRGSSLGLSLPSLTEDAYTAQAQRETHEIARYAHSREEIKARLMLVEVNRSKSALEYLKRRAIIDNIYDGSRQAIPEFLWNERYKDLYILNLSDNQHDILGYQVRHTQARYRRFDTFTWGDIHSKVFETPQDEELVRKFQKPSMVWRFMSLDYRLPIYSLEGALDAWFIPNAIACWGLSNMVYNKRHRYITDNDTAGRQKAIELLSKGYSVFQWKTFEEDCLQHGININGCKDINDIVCRYPTFKFDDIDRFFTQDELNALFL